MYEFEDNAIKTSDGRTVMHSWETPIMEKMAEWVCHSGGDILEIGFGLGISSDFIQSHNINSHTICENHPDIIKDLEEWSTDKPNVKIVRGDWYQNLDKFETYDGILYDTFADINIETFKKTSVYNLSKQVTNVCLWDDMEEEFHKDFPDNLHRSEKIDVEIDYENSWNYVVGKNLYLHRIQITK